MINNCDIFSLCVDDIRKLFTEVRYSEKGSNDRGREEEALMFFCGLFG